jgi:hypothetical protein
MNIEESYEGIKDPKNFVKLFDSDKDFIEWCEMGTVYDLYCTLEFFKAAQLYWHCYLISNVIRDKKEKGNVYISFYLEPMIMIDNIPFYGVGELIDFGNGMSVELNYN